MKANIKDILRDDIPLLIDILEELGFHSIRRWSGKEIRCALPDGDCNSSVSIKLNQWINVEIYTRSSFDDYDIRDIFALVMFITGKTLDEVEQYLCMKTGLKYDGDTSIAKYKASDMLKIIRQFKPKSTEDEFAPEYLDDSEFDKYTPAIIDEWLDEGIDAETQTLFGICISKSNGRWCFPLYDEIGLRAFKGRASGSNWKILGLMKYLYMPKIGRNDIMYGYHLTMMYILAMGIVIIVEGEKSVMKLWSMGIRNVISVGKKGINPHILKKIKALRVDVVLAYDKDVLESELIKDCEKLNHLTNVSYLLDDGDLLSGTDSPPDRGIDVWNELYNNRRKG